MRLYRCSTPKSPSCPEVNLGYWYANSADEARHLARVRQEKGGTSYTATIVARPSKFAGRALNEEAACA